MSIWFSPAPRESNEQDEHRETNVWSHSLHITPSVEVIRFLYLPQRARLMVFSMSVSLTRAGGFWVEGDGRV